MKRLFNSRKRIALVATAAALGLSGGAVIAYFTGTGSGTGTGSTGTATNTISVVGTESGALQPGGVGGTVSFKASNGSNFNQKLSNIHLSDVTAKVGSTDVTSSCPFSNSWSMTDVSVASDGNLAPNASNTSLTETGTLYMLDNGADQSNCEGATLTLTFTTQ
jgi:hypothetical protein